MELVRPLASKQGLETPLELWGFFVDQVRRMLGTEGTERCENGNRVTSSAVVEQLWGRGAKGKRVV